MNNFKQNINRCPLCFQSINKEDKPKKEYYRIAVGVERKKFITEIEYIESKAYYLGEVADSEIRVKEYTVAEDFILGDFNGVEVDRFYDKKSLIEEKELAIKLLKEIAKDFGSTDLLILEKFEVY